MVRIGFLGVTGQAARKSLCAAFFMLQDRWKSA
jgi:hypothetical protein